MSEEQVSEALTQRVLASLEANAGFLPTGAYLQIIIAIISAIVTALKELGVIKD